MESCRSGSSVFRDFVPLEGLSSQKPQVLHQIARGEVPWQGGANQVAIAARLIAWLKQGGTCAVTTNDALGSSYPTCGLWPGSSPTLQLSDKRNLLYTLSLQLINLAASPVAMNAVYK